MRDLYQKTRPSTSTSTTGELTETPAEGTQPQEGSRKKLCINFLQTIDQTGQYEPLYSSSIHDPVKVERASRLDSLTQVVMVFRVLDILGLDGRLWHSFFLAVPVYLLVWSYLFALIGACMVM